MQSYHTMADDRLSQQSFEYPAQSGLDAPRHLPYYVHPTCNQEALTGLGPSPGIYFGASNYHAPQSPNDSLNALSEYWVEGSQPVHAYDP